MSASVGGYIATLTPMSAAGELQLAIFQDVQSMSWMTGTRQTVLDMLMEEWTDAKEEGTRPDPA